MKKTVKWMFAMILVLCMVFSTVGIRSYAAGTEKAVKIGDLQFDTLGEAVEAGNAMIGEEPVEIEAMDGSHQTNNTTDMVASFLVHAEIQEDDGQETPVMKMT